LRWTACKLRNKIAQNPKTRGYPLYTQAIEQFMHFRSFIGMHKFVGDFFNYPESLSNICKEPI